MNCETAVLFFQTPNMHKSRVFKKIFRYNLVKREEQEVVWVCKDFVGNVRFVHP